MISKKGNFLFNEGLEFKGYLNYVLRFEIALRVKFAFKKFNGAPPG